MPLIIPAHRDLASCVKSANQLRACQIENFFFFFWLCPLSGYLCVHLEKDETLGSTLILTWVPNSRIQRQDEEALRYITPESSPVRRNPRRRAHRSHSRPPPAPEEEEDEEPALQNQQLLEEGDEGSCELSADEVSRDSTLGSDSDTFSSPFCLSPVSEALGESSSSVFLDNESRWENICMQK